MDTLRTIDGPDLVAPTAALHWYEAIAVVQQVAETVQSAGSGLVPDLSHIRLSSDGTVSILPGSPSGNQPVTQLTDTLRTLLQHAAVPSEISKAVAQAADRPADDQDVGRFIESLHYFERPDRAAVLTALVERVNAAVAEAKVAENLEAVVAKVREAATTPVTPKSEPSKPAARRRNMALFVVVALVVVSAGGALAWWTFQPLSTGPGRTLSSAVSRASKRVAKAVNSGVDRLFGASAPAPEPKVAEAAAAPTKPASHPRRKPKAREVAEPPAVAVVPQTTSLDLPGLIAPTALEPAPSIDPLITERVLIRQEPDPERLYSRLDFGVSPPIPMQPSLGRVTTDVTGVAGDMDVVVDETGHVARVTLLRPNRYQDRWLIYAIKAREFKPANVDGRPVKYVLRMRTGL